MSMNQSSGSSKSAPYSKWVSKYFQNQYLPRANELVGQYDPTGGQQRSLAEGQLSDTMGGKYLTPDTNEYLRQNLATSGAAGQGMFADNRSNITGGADPSSLLGRATAGVADFQGGNLDQDIAGQQAGQIANNYARERAYQAGSIPAAAEASKIPFANLLQLLNLFKAPVSSSKNLSSPFALVTGGQF